MILNLQQWRNRKWQAIGIGIGIYGGYAVMWVGEETGP